MNTPPPARLACRQTRSFRPAGLEENFRDRMSLTHYIKKKEAEDVKNQICAVYNSNEDWKGLASVLGVKRATVYQ